MKHKLLIMICIPLLAGCSLASGMALGAGGATAYYYKDNLKGLI
ncbi:MAG: hypothetical protein ACON5A_03240 [Candidatus Comchoanobacterales bacterium]